MTCSRRTGRPLGQHTPSDPRWWNLEPSPTGETFPELLARRARNRRTLIRLWGAMFAVVVALALLGGFVARGCP